MLPVTAAVDAVTLPVEERVLDNGLTVLVHPDHRAPILAVSVVYRAGSARDPAEAPGLAHLVEHLMFEGSPAAPNNAYDSWLAQVGAANNAWTEPDLTAFYAWGPPGMLDLALFLEADRMAGLEPGKDALANQLAIVEQERRQTLAGDRAWARRAVDAAIWPPAHPYHRPVLGADELALVDLQVVLDHADRWLVPANAVLVVAGDVAPAAAFAAAERWFAELPPGAPAPPLEGPPARHGRWYAEPGRANPEVWVSWPLAPEHDALAVLLAEVLDERVGALVGRSVLDAGASSWSGELGGLLSLDLAVAERGTARAARRLRRSLKRVARFGVPRASLDRAAMRLWSETLTDLEDVASRASTLGWCHARTGRPDCTEQRVATWLGAEPDDLRDLARVLLEREPTIVHLSEPIGTYLELP